jgi:hypothetical protein
MARTLRVDPVIGLSRIARAEFVDRDNDRSVVAVLARLLSGTRLQA